MISSNVLKNSVKIEYALDALTNFKIKRDVPNDVYCQWITGAPFSRPALSVASVFVYHADTIFKIEVYWKTGHGKLAVHDLEST